MRTAVRMSETKKEQDQHGPGEAGLYCVHESEEDAGEDRREDQRGECECVGGVPLLAGGGDARKREPVVGDGEARQQKAAEEDLFEERRQQDAEGGDDPDVGRGAEELVHGDGFRGGNQGRDGEHNERDGDADGDQAKGVAGSSRAVELQAGSKGFVPEERKDDPRDGESSDVAEGFGGDEEFGWDGVGGGARGADGLSGWKCSELWQSVSDAEQEELRKEQQHCGDGEEEQCVAKMGDARGWLGVGSFVGGVVHRRLQDGFALGEDRDDGTRCGNAAAGPVFGS